MPSQCCWPLLCKHFHAGSVFCEKGNTFIMQQTSPIAASGTLTLGGDLTIYRLGFGAMRLPGRGVWGPSENKQEALAVLRRAVELGINFIDTADSYGPE